MATAEVSWGRPDKTMCQGQVVAWPEKGLARSTVIVGLGHKARRGKDTVAAHLVRKYAETGLRVQRYSFATALKAEVFDWLQGFHAEHDLLAKFQPDSLYPHPSPALIGWDDSAKVQWVDSNKAAIRSLLQRWGTDFRRAHDADYWVNKTHAAIIADRPHVAVLSDMRFKNEAGICDVTIRVERKGFVLSEPGVAIHISEKELDDYPYDYEIEAEDGDVKGLCAKAEEVFDKILLEHRVGF